MVNVAFNETMSFETKHKECPLKRQLVGRVVHSSEIQVAKATNRQKNCFVEESTEPSFIKFRQLQQMLLLFAMLRTDFEHV